MLDSLPDHLLMISAMSASVTSSFSMRRPSGASSSCFSAAFRSFCRLMRVLYFSSAALQ